MTALTRAVFSCNKKQGARLFRSDNNRSENGNHPLCLNTQNIKILSSFAYPVFLALSIIPLTLNKILIATNGNAGILAFIGISYMSFKRSVTEGG